MVKNSEKLFPKSEVPMEELNNLFEESTTPRKEFVEDLKAQVVSQYRKSSSQSNFISQLFMKFSRPTLRIAAMATMLVLATGAASYSYFGQKLTPVANQDEILAKIAQASEKAKTNTSRENASLTSSATAGQDAKISALYFRPQEERDYNYQKTTTIYEFGAALSICKQLVPYQGEVTKDELTQYFTEKDSYFANYNKNVVYSNSEIYDYNLSIDTDQWQYRGGEYAVHLTNVQRMMPLAASSTLKMGLDDTAPAENTVTNTIPETVIVAPAENPEILPSQTDPKEVIKNYFGEDAKILGMETRNGKEYYKVQWSYKATCGDLATSPDRSISSSSAEFNQTVVIVAYADTTDFSIDQESQYLDAVANRNLVFSRITEDARKTVASFEDVKNEFSYTYAKPIKTIDASAYQYEKEYRTAVLEYLSKNMTKVIKMGSAFTLQNLSSSYVSVVPDHQKHLIDRAFYSNSSFGEALYKDSKDMFIPYQENGKSYPNVQLSYAGTGALGWLNLSEVSGELKGEDAVKTLGYVGASFTSKGDLNVLVDGIKVTANVFEIVPQPNVVSGSTGSSSGSESGVIKESEQTVPELILPRDESPYREVFVVFTSGDVTVIAQTSVPNKVTNTEIGKNMIFTGVSTTDVITLGKALPIATSTVQPEMYLR